MSDIKKSFFTRFIMFMGIVGSIVIVLVVGYVLWGVWGWYHYYGIMKEERDQRYRMVNYLPDFNDTKLDEYNRSLSRLTETVIKTDDPYMLFKVEAQEKILRVCVLERFEQIDKKLAWKYTYKFVDNARNHQLYHDEDKMKAYKKHEWVYSEYYYEFNNILVDNSIKKLHEFTKNTSGAMCDRENTVDKRYQQFLLFYLKGYYDDSKNDLPATLEAWRQVLIKREPHIWSKVQDSINSNRKIVEKLKVEWWKEKYHTNTSL